MEASLKLGNGDWGVKNDSLLAYDDVGGKFRPLPFDFTRASSATVVNKQGLIETVQSGIPRIDFSDDANGALKLEPQSTNLITYSEDFSNGSWTKTGSAAVTTNTTISPNGTQNADTLNIFSGNFFFQPIIGSGTFTLSCYVKVPNGTLDFKMQSFNSTDGANSSGIFVATTEWQRFEHTVTVTVNSSFYPIQVSGLVGGDFEIYGAQVEALSYPTSYIPTSSASATRNQELCNNATPVINSTEGVLYAEIKGFENDLSGRYISLSDGTSNNSIRIYYYSNGGTVFFRKNVNNVGVITSATSAISQSALTKIAIRYDSTSFDVFSNGIKILTNLDSNTFSNNTLNTISFTTDDGSGSPFYGNTKGLKYYPKALADVQLQDLTTI
tara:strand:- start:69 stop:1220 length:1152 start_codon:yes stop_codon:yes gene_type:complete